MPGKSLPLKDGLAVATAPSSHRARLSLRMLMAIIAAGCVVGGYYANRFHQQRQVVDMVRRHGGQIRYDDGRQAADRPAGRLDRWLLPEIQEISLFFAPIADVDLDVLRHCRQLKRLNLDYTPISDHGLALLVPLSSLRRLDVKETRITDEGMAMIAQLPHLQSLVLDGIALTDLGLRQLEAISSLSQLSVRRTQVSPEGLERFQRANPDCYVFR